MQIKYEIRSKRTYELVRIVSDGAASGTEILGEYDHIQQLDYIIHALKMADAVELQASRSPGHPQPPVVVIPPGPAHGVPGEAAQTVIINSKPKIIDTPYSDHPDEINQFMAQIAKT